MNDLLFAFLNDLVFACFNDLVFAFLNDLVTNEHSNLNEIHKNASSLTEYHTVVTTPELVPEEALQKGHKLTSWSS